MIVRVVVTYTSELLLLLATYNRACVDANTVYERMSQTSEYKEQEGHESSVSKEQECTGGSFDLKFSHVEMDAIKEEVDSGETTCQERSPPPMIILQSQIN